MSIRDEVIVKQQQEIKQLQSQLEAEASRVKALVSGLEAAISLIKQYHNCDEVWDIYYNNAPEMKPIREALKNYQQ